MEYLFEVGAPIGEEAAPAILARRGIPSLAFDLDVRDDAPFDVDTETLERTVRRADRVESARCMLLPDPLDAGERRPWPGPPPTCPTSAAARW